jgi:serine/threonine protein kinase
MAEMVRPFAPSTPGALAGSEPARGHLQDRATARKLAVSSRWQCAWRLDEDGAQVWAIGEGDELVPGLQGWQRLGVGLRCETWLAWSPVRCCPVTVKLPRPQQVTHPRAWASLTREVYVLTRARHPVLPQLYENRLDFDVPHLIMEYVDGLTLREELDESGRLPAPAAALLAAHLLTALVVVHATGAAHLDIKPDNIMIRDGRPILLDFGSARPLGHRQPIGRPVGTLGYAAPEMEACAPIAASMDIYGVGMVLREVLGHPGPGSPNAQSLHRRRGLAGRVDRLAERLTDPDPQIRPTLPEALALVGVAAGPGRLWPTWVHPERMPVDRP